MYEDILKIREAKPDYVPVSASSIPLVRMSRRLVGAYTMDESENKKRMPDSIGMTGDWRKRGPAFELPFGSLYTEAVPTCWPPEGHLRHGRHVGHHARHTALRRDGRSGRDRGVHDRQLPVAGCRRASEKAGRTGRPPAR
jgi:hypothetical protein